MGISTSRLCDRRAYRGRIDGEYRMRAPSVASRSRTRGWRTATGPMPVMISRSGRWPWRTTRCWPVSVLRSACFARNSATSASTAWVRSARAPLRRTSVKESVKTPGWASLMTLLSDTAYPSFIGEVEALNTTTIRRLIPSARHQLPAIALSSHTAPDVRPLLERLCLVHRLLLFPVGQWPRPNNAAPSLQPHYRAFDATTGCSAPAPRFGTLALAVGAACGLSLHVLGRDEAQVLTFHTKAWSSFAPPTCRMPLGQYQGIPRADPGGRVTPGSDIA